jgi:hypothetical protein
VDEVTAVAGSCIGLCKPGLWVLGQKPKTSTRARFGACRWKLRWCVMEGDGVVVWTR